MPLGCQVEKDECWLPTPCEKEGNNLDCPADSAAKQNSSGSIDPEEVRKLLVSARTDRNAVAQLYRIHYPTVAAYVHRRVSNRDDADDIVSEVFIAMVKGLPGFRWSGVPFGVWLYRIAINKISRWARQRRSIVLDQWEELQAKPIESAPHIDTELIGLALDSLPTKMQDVLSLYYLEGLNVAEIAKILNRSQGTVKSRLHSGRILMRLKLEKRGIPIE